MVLNKTGRASASADLQILPYSADHDSAEWDEFIARASTATFLHSRRFLSYHLARFKDVSVVLKDNRQKIVGLFPAAVDLSNPCRVVSHPGITFGGLLHDGSFYGESMIAALEALRAHYAESGFESLRYKAVPYIYHRGPSSDDLYALFRLRATRYRCDLSCAIDLASRGTPSTRRVRGLKKALRAHVSVREGVEYAAPFWDLLEENLRKKYGAKPVHSVDEIITLHSLFPQNINIVVALQDSEVVAGVVLFVSSRVTHVQYAASGDVGYNLCALDAVFEHCIEQAAARRARYFDFGTSNENEGEYLNSTLYQFKLEFGGGGVAYECYELTLKS